ncbi:MAG TPA: LysM domain-containing protein [Thermoanaerobaculia bacterium]|jgi:hypothetical protein|nr:LysM domain-containing protein [Thermoanaerobaculia bacterium]
MFSSNSRYLNAGTYTVTKPDGTLITATRLPLPGVPNVIGSHGRLDGHRLDHIASHYLSDATEFWRLCDANDAPAPDALAAHDRIEIPETRR